MTITYNGNNEYEIDFYTKKIVLSDDEIKEISSFDFKNNRAFDFDAEEIGEKVEKVQKKINMLQRKIEDIATELEDIYEQDLEQVVDLLQNVT